MLPQKPIYSKDGRNFVLEKNIGDRGKAFRVVKLFCRVLIFRGLDTI